MIKVMIIILSPSKTLGKINVNEDPKPSQPLFLEKSKKIVSALRKLTASDLQELMSISPTLAHLNVERYLRWQTPFDKRNSHPALLQFKGDVYEGLDAESFAIDDFNYAQKSVRILSGLYGALRPLNLMQPYRL